MANKLNDRSKATRKAHSKTGRRVADRHEAEVQIADEADDLTPFWVEWDIEREALDALGDNHDWISL